MIGSKDRARAATYTQLAAMERAGLSLLKAIDHVCKQGGAGAVLLRPLAADLHRGQSFPEAIQAAPGFSPLEVAVLSAGSTAGSMPECFQQLAKTYERRAAVKMAILGKLAYPTLLLHLAILLPNLSVIVTDGLLAYGLAIAVPFGVIYGVIIGGVMGAKILRTSSPALLDRILLSIPLVGAVARKSSLAYGFGALSLLYNNGVPVLTALETAATVTPNSVVAGVFQRCADSLRQDGSTVSAALSQESHNLPSWAVELLSTGSVTGQLDEMLKNVTQRLDEEAEAGVTRLVMVLGGVVFAFAAMAVAYKVISFFSGYADMINGLSK
ncbi:MAG: type II secretion system F family protein [Planctomycetes bacterium]|nr:type II secretion system F family protein [Planctomycetota bacterium]